MANGIEQSTGARPLNGDCIYSLKVSTTSGQRVLARRRYAMEFGLHERVRTAPHDGLPGVNVIDLFEAPLQDSDNEPMPLEAAIERDPRHMRFLLSAADADLVVITSRIGYGVSGEVNVAKQKHGKPLPDIDMHDLSTEHVLDMTDRHLLRLRARGGDPYAELEQPRADDIFRRILSNTVEVR